MMRSRLGLARPDKLCFHSVLSLSDMVLHFLLDVEASKQDMASVLTEIADIMAEDHTDSKGADFFGILMTS